MKTSETKNKIKRNSIWVLLCLMLVLLLYQASVSLAAEDTWVQKTNIPTARYDFSTSVVNGKIYAIGGGTSFYTKSGLKIVEEYDPVTDTWTRKKDMPTGRQALSTCVANGKIYAIGGIISPPGSGLRTVEEYDPVTDTWTRKSNMPTARAGLVTAVVNDKIYAIGGVVNAPGPGLATVEEYDPLSDTWTRKTDMPIARHFPGVGVVDGKILVIGGILNCEYTSSLSTVEEYDPATDTWTAKTSMPTARTALSACVVNGKIYAIGGASNYKSTATIFSTVEEYDPVTDSWMSMAEMPTARQSLSTNVVNGKIYAIGGSTIAFPWLGNAIVEEYDTGLSVPSPDFNGDGIVDIKDLLRLIESWGQDDPLVDIAPPPFGDDVVDALDLELLMSFWEQPVDDPTLIAHWALDEAEGTFAYDNAGLNDAVVVGDTEWQPSSGQVDGALHFDGVSGCAISGPVLNPADGHFSVFIWINGGEPGQVVLSQLNGANWLGADPDFGCLMTELMPPEEGRFVPQPLKCEFVIADGQWHRIGFVWDGENRLLYVDDILVAEDTQNNLSSSLGGLNIGCGSNSETGTFWSGLIDDIRIYNRVVRP